MDVRSAGLQIGMISTESISQVSRGAGPQITALGNTRRYVDDEDLRNLHQPPLPSFSPEPQPCLIEAIINVSSSSTCFDVFGHFVGNNHELCFHARIPMSST